MWINMKSIFIWWKYYRRVSYGLGSCVEFNRQLISRSCVFAMNGWYERDCSCFENLGLWMMVRKLRLNSSKEFQFQVSVTIEEIFDSSFDVENCCKKDNRELTRINCISSWPQIQKNFQWKKFRIFDAFKMKFVPIDKLPCAKVHKPHWNSEVHSRFENENSTYLNETNESTK